MSNKCDKCHHKCHCDGGLHADEYGICTCDDCECKDDRIQNSDGVNEKSADARTSGQDED